MLGKPILRSRKHQNLFFAVIALVALTLALASCNVLGSVLGLTPTAAFTYSPASPHVGDTIILDASNSSGSSISSYSWKVTKPDNTSLSLSGVAASFVPASAGFYSVKLTVTNDAGSGTSNKAITVLPGSGGGGGGSVAVTGVTVTPTSTFLVIGGQKMLYASVAPNNATTPNVIWSSSNDVIASVSPQGVVTALAVGTAIITATTVDGGKTATCTVTVSGTAVSVSGITLTETTVPLQPGSTHNMHFTIAPPNATNQNVGWSSANTSIATVAQDGLVTAVNTGQTTISVISMDGYFQGSCIVTVSGIPVASVSVNPPAISTLLVGGTQTITATVLPINAADKAVVWSSSDISRATVNSNGIVTGIAAGPVMITATAHDGSGKTASSSVTVVAGAVPVSGVTLNSNAISLAVGASQTLTATIAPTNAANQAVTWSSTDTAVATVTPSGVVTGFGGGSAAILVITQDGGKLASCQVTVTANVAVTGVSLSSAATSLLVNGTTTLYANVQPTNATNKNVTWSSTDPTKVSVNLAGLVTANALGSATIIAITADGSKMAYCQVTVTNSTVAVAGVTLNQSNATLSVGSTLPVIATIAPASATNQGINWSTSNPNVAVVNTSGSVTAISSGTATITATTADGGKTASFVVTVTVPVSSVTISQSSLLLNVGSSQILTAFISPSIATDQAVSWSSSNSAKASVSTTGNVLAVAAGSATITVSSHDGNHSAFCTVTVTALNHSPNVPNAPSPANNALGVDPLTLMTLGWVGGDQDSGDSATYDVYLGTGTMSLVASNMAGTGSTASYPLGGSLSYNTNYKWQIVARDTHGATSSGPLWSFTTTFPPVSTNTPPVLSNAYPSVSQILSGNPITLYSTAYDTDFGQTLTYAWSIVNSPAGSTAAIVNANLATATFTPSVAGAYAFKVTVTDDGTPVLSSAMVFSVIVSPSTSGGYGYGIQ